MTNTALSIQDQFVETPAALRSASPTVLSVQARQCFQEGMACLQSGDAAAAVAALSRSIEHAPDYTDAHVFLGLAHALSYDIYPAMDQLRRSLPGGATQLQAANSTKGIRCG